MIDLLAEDGLGPDLRDAVAIDESIDDTKNGPPVANHLDVVDERLADAGDRSHP